MYQKSYWTTGRTWSKLFCKQLGQHLTSSNGHHFKPAVQVILFTDVDMNPSYAVGQICHLQGSPILCFQFLKGKHNIYLSAI